MSMEHSRAVYLSVQELLILFYKRKISGLVFPEEIGEASADDRQLKQAMEGLIAGRHLEPEDGERFRVAQETDRWMCLLADATQTCVVRTREPRGERRNFIYRRDQEALLLEMDRTHDAWVRIEEVSFSEALSRAADHEAPVLIEAYRRGENKPEKTLRLTPGKDDRYMLETGDGRRISENCTTEELLQALTEPDAV